jgi:phosphoketolase
MDAYRRAANHLSVGQIYLYDNPLLKEPLELSHVKPLVVGHWGTTPGQNFIYVHLNRVIKKNMTWICSTAMRPSSASSTQCSANMPSGSR